MMRAGAPLHAIQHFLGHKRATSTQIYTKVDPREIRDVVDRMDFCE